MSFLGFLIEVTVSENWREERDRIVELLESIERVKRPTSTNPDPESFTRQTPRTSRIYTAGSRY